ncbi:nucleotide pyrophosphatase/phosphodiesterase family protein [Priestia abyssalis]|uniref:nucleotide pyrophosphatase/phosphodiesterase family protein n=1 Tax=Priestia abyssalis TaxID=1221450 RepID=UPI001115D712|nr:nucleotide pyrophosphatase/phosphodiesterase family protein [Priestia abyssalis]
MIRKTFTAIIVIGLCCINAQAVWAVKEEQQQVILISFDGMRNDLTKKYVNEGKLPHIQKVMQSGVTAEYSTTISPSLTAPSHAAIATGTTPSKTGIVSNQWHEAGTSLGNLKDAFHAELGVSPLWIEARKQGKKTATVAFAGANPKVEKQGDYSIYYGDTWSESRLETLAFQKAKGWNQVPDSFSPLKEASFSIKLEKVKNHVIHVLALDTEDDGHVHYDTFIFSEDKTIDKKDERARGTNWGSLNLKVKENQTAGFSFKFKKLDENVNEAKMYRTAVTSGVIDGPEGFSKDIKERFGFFPVQDDTKAIKKGWITRKEYEDISTRFVKWVTDVSLYIKQTYNPDLLMFYAPQIDHEQHEYLLADPRQPGYSPEKSKQYMQYVEWSYKLADQVVGQTLDSLGPNESLLIVSDHGMEPAHSLIQPNKVLKDAGLLVLDKNGKINHEKTKAYAVASGSAAHVYINLNKREKGGSVTEQEYKAIESQVMELFKEEKVELPNSKEVIQYNIDQIINSVKQDGLDISFLQERTKEIYGAFIHKDIHPYGKVINTSGTDKKKVGHSHSGDILLMAAPGYVMGSGFSSLVKPAEELGTHGGDPKRKELRPIFMATGHQIAEERTIPPVSNLDVAPTVYKLLGLELPSFVEGKPIEEVFE